MGSSYTEDAKCPLCEQNNAGLDLETRCYDSRLDCHNPECRFSHHAEMVTAPDGKLFWKETTWYPVDADGKVRRPKQ